MPTVNEKILVAQIAETVESTAPQGSYNFDDGPPIVSGHEGLQIYEFVPCNSDASLIRIITNEGTSQVDIELDGDAHFEWILGKRDSETEFVDRLLELIKAVILKGFTQELWVRGSTILKSKTVVEGESGRKYRVRVSGIARPSFQRTTRTRMVYAAWGSGSE